jgi:hypothetical protein
MLRNYVLCFYPKGVEGYYYLVMYLVWICTRSSSRTLSSTQQTRNDVPKGGSRGEINIWICTQSSYPDFKLCAARDVCVHKDFKERDVEKTALRRQFRGSALAHAKTQLACTGGARLRSRRAPWRASSHDTQHCHDTSNPEPRCEHLGSETDKCEVPL